MTYNNFFDFAFMISACCIGSLLYHLLKYYITEKKWFNRKHKVTEHEHINLSQDEMLNDVMEDIIKRIAKNPEDDKRYRDILIKIEDKVKLELNKLNDRYNSIEL